MDAIDRKILAELQRDASLANTDLAERVGLSPTPCWRRVKQLEASGVLRRRVALLDPAALGLGTTVFVAVKTRHHTADWLDRFARVVSAFEEITEFYRLSGEIDYLLKVVVPDIAAYDAFYKRLVAAIELSDVSSSFAMEEIKYTTELPLG
ncbi:Lrp/AsnC family transcriptional regulator [Algihabitans albus]|uniref:Lrp/AsnC family transcriptional regulator n=1 Tax=Algihabitans albus TaxID=2164067 RepID=UPI000E5C6F00|nr:Lrp/AsnC family transcriptional regulator [Algihabitans albus]